MSSQERVDIQARNGRMATLPVGAGNGVRPGPDRLPRPPGRRRPGLAVLAVLLIVLGATVAGLLATRIDQRVPVLVARHEIGVGQLISTSDLAVAEVASSGLKVIPAGQASQVVGRYAASTIAPGRLIDGEMLSTSGLLGPGKAAVGVALGQGRYPAGGLKSGDVVQVIKTDGPGKVLTASAVVGSVQKPGSTVFGSSGDSASTLVTLIVTQDVSPAIAAAGVAQQLSLVLLRRGGGPN